MLTTTALHNPIENLSSRIDAVYQETGLPFVTLTYAQTLDGSISAQLSERTMISGQESMVMTHQLRSAHDAILVGIDTVLADNPSLTLRGVAGQPPQPIILDSRLRFPLTCRVMEHPVHRPWIAVTDAADPVRAAQLAAQGVRVLRLPANPAGWVDLRALLECLAANGVRSLMVEGGAKVITSFVAARLFNQMVVTVAPRLIGGLRAVSNLGITHHDEFPTLVNVSYQQLGNDLVVMGELA